MIVTESNFNRIKDEESYKINFSSHETIESFNSYVKNILDIENINILINNIIRIINIINEKNEDNSELEIKELILKANLSENSENFKEVLGLLGDSSDEKILKINRIIDKKLLENLDTKIDLLIELEGVCEYFYPNFSDKLIMNRFEESIQKDHIDEKQKNKHQKLNIDKLCKQLTEEEAEKLIQCLKDKFGFSFLKRIEKWLKKHKG